MESYSICQSHPEHSLHCIQLRNGQSTVGGPQCLVAHCSATPASVAATPPCSATPFQRHSWPFKGDRCDRAFQGGCSAIPLLHLKNPRILRKSAATRVARQGVHAHVCNYASMDQNGLPQAKMEPFGPFWSGECQNPVRNKVILIKMVVGPFWTKRPFWSSTLSDSTVAIPYQQDKSQVLF